MFLCMLDLGKAVSTFLRLSFGLDSTFQVTPTKHVNPGTRRSEEESVLLQPSCRNACFPAAAATRPQHLAGAVGVEGPDTGHRLCCLRLRWFLAPAVGPGAGDPVLVSLSS